MNAEGWILGATIVAGAMSIPALIVFVLDRLEDKFKIILSLLLFAAITAIVIYTSHEMMLYVKYRPYK